jgi:hypothetical protein
MRVGTRRRKSAGYRYERASRNALQTRMGGAALACVALASAWTLYVNLAGADAGMSVDPDPADVVGTRGDKLAIAKPRPSAQLDRYAFLFDPRSFLGSAPATLANSAPLQAGLQAAVSAASQVATRDVHDASSIASSGDRTAPGAAAPMPPVKLSRNSNATLRDRDRGRASRDVAAAAEKPTIFEKLFGKPAAVGLAYASAEDVPSEGQNGATGRYDRWTAVYDISAHTVYLPDGTQLEAHSGLGSRLDDARYAAEKNVGVTPPNVYDLEPREAPFHGVRALRLIPQDEAKVFGRSGLLAHSFMLGPKGDSNGCVSFRDYEAFRQAYDRQLIKRLVVVSRLE